MDHKIVVGFLEVSREHLYSSSQHSDQSTETETRTENDWGERANTISANIKIDDISDPDVDNAQEALILLLKLLLVKDLDREDAIFGDSTVQSH